jgi:hypothetical protein
LVMSSRRPKDTDSAPILPTPTPHHSPGETTSSRARDPMRPYVEPNAGAIDTPWRTPYRAPADHDTGLLGSTPSDAARGRTRQPEIGWWGALGRSRGAVGPRGGGRADRLVGGRRSLPVTLHMARDLGPCYKMLTLLLHSAAWPVGTTSESVATSTRCCFTGRHRIGVRWRR